MPTDFEKTATETATKMTALLESADQAQSGLTELRGQIAQISEQIDTSWSQLSDRAQSLLARVTNAKEEVTAETESLSQGVAQLKNNVETLQNETSQEQEETKAEITAFGDELETRKSELETILQEVEGSLKTLKDKVEEVEGELENNLSEQESHMQNDFSSEVQTHQADLEQRASDLQAYITGESIPAITQMVTEFATQLESGIEQMNQKTQELKDSTEKSAHESIDQFKQNQEDVFGELLNTGKELEQMMGQLSNLVDTGGTTVVSAKDTLVDGVQTTNMGLETALGLVEEVKRILDRFI